MVDHQQVALEDQEKWMTLKQGLRPYKEACELLLRKLNFSVRDYYKQLQKMN